MTTYTLGVQTLQRPCGTTNSTEPCEPYELVANGMCVRPPIRAMSCTRGRRWEAGRAIALRGGDRRFRSAMMSRSRSGRAFPRVHLFGSVPAIRAEVERTGELELTPAPFLAPAYVMKRSPYRNGMALTAVGILSAMVSCAPCPAVTPPPQPAPSQPPPAPSPTVENTAVPETPAAGRTVKEHGPAMELPSLAEKLSDSFSIGVAVAPHHIEDMGDIIVHHFNRITAEDAMKLGPLCASPKCDFADADRVAEFAREHELAVNGHTFVWHRMVPEWIFKDGDGAASKQTVSKRLRDHIFALTKRYADVVDNWDVVNEAISDSADKTYRTGDEGSQWHTAFGGEAYVKAAFSYAAQAAKEYDPKVKLYYNDYNVVKTDKRKKIIQMVRRLRKEGVRVDGVGLQAHWNLDWPPVDEIRTAIDELVAEGLEVKISELDVSLYGKDDHATETWQPELEFTPELQERMKARYVEIFEVLLEKSEQLAHVTLWGVDDGRSWLNGWPAKRENHPLLFDRDHQPKPALLAILQL